MYFPESANIIAELPITREHVDALDTWLAALLPAHREFIVPGDLAHDLDIPHPVAVDLLSRAVRVGLLRIRWLIVCPDCSDVVETAYDLRDLSDMQTRHRCSEGHVFVRDEEPDTLRVYFELVKRPNRFAQKNGQPVRSMPETLARLGTSPSFQNVALNHALSQAPDPTHFKELMDRFRNHAQQTNAEKGRALQDIAEYLVSLVPSFEAHPTIHTDVAEIDLSVRIGHVPYQHGVLNELMPVFNIECRNHAEPMGSDYIYQSAARAKDHGNTAVMIISRSGFTKDAITLANRGAGIGFRVMLVDRESLEHIEQNACPFLDTVSQWFHNSLIHRHLKT